VEMTQSRIVHGHNVMIITVIRLILLIIRLITISD